MAYLRNYSGENGQMHVQKQEMRKKIIMRMKSDNFALCLVALLCLALSGGVAALRADGDSCQGHPAKDQQALEQCNPADQPASFNKTRSLIGMKVRNQAGTELGTIKDLVIDLRSGHVAYAVLGTRSGFLGLHEKFLAVPLKAFTPNAEERCLVLQAEKQSVQQAMGFRRNHLPELGTPAWVAEPFWRQSESESVKPAVSPGTIEADEPGAKSDDPEAQPEAMNESVDPELQGMVQEEADVSRPWYTQGIETTERHVETGKSGVASVDSMDQSGCKPTQFNRGHRWIGMTVRDPQGRELGTIKDIVIDLQTERVSYVVLVRTGFLGANKKLFAVPLNAFQPIEDWTYAYPLQDRSYLVLNADKHSLDTAQGFPSDQWPSVSNPSWGAEPAWQGKSDLRKPASTDTKKTRREGSRPEYPDEYPPGTLGYPGW
jgi:sporulation protein YlmC with PRC-barrel domain